MKQILLIAGIGIFIIVVSGVLVELLGETVDTSPFPSVNMQN